MKVLHFYKTYFPDTVGGIEQVINHLVCGAASCGVESDVLTLSPEKGESCLSFQGHKIYRVHEDLRFASTGFSLSAFHTFVQLAQKADIIHYHFPWAFMDIVHFATRPWIKKPTLVTYHSDIVRQKNLLKLYTPLQNRFLGSVDRIVASSPNYLETSPVLQKFHKKATVIPIGIDRSFYPALSLDRLSFWKDKLGARFFLFVGVLRYYKGLNFLLEAAKNTPDIPIAIVGSGPVESELKKQAKDLGLTNVHFLGALSDEDKMALFELCTGLVFPSHLRSEAFGVSLLESAMMRKPMISCEIGTGTSYINIADETGLVVPPGDPTALGQAMRFLWNNPEIAQKMGEAARARYERVFTAEKMVDSYIKLYHELAGVPEYSSNRIFSRDHSLKTPSS